MVNKGALSVLGVIVLVSMGVGVLIGMQLGSAGPGQADNATAGDTSPTPTVAPTPVNTPVMTAPPISAQTTILPRRFDAKRIEQLVVENVNQRREQRGLRPLTNDGAVPTTLTRMARYHSVQMADESRVRHSINGNSSLDRYQAYGLMDSCGFSSNNGAYLISASGNRLETIDRTPAGRSYVENGQLRFAKTNQQVADAIVRQWFDNSVFKERLLYVNAMRIGVGVEVVRNGNVYTTANLC